MKIKNIKIEIKPTPEEMAKEFCNMDGHAQAAFFNSIHKEIVTWDCAFCFQLQSILDSKKLTLGGKSIMESIGEYGGAYYAK